MFMEQKKEKTNNNNIRRASAAGTLESFYRDGTIGASLHLQEPPLKGHLWELLWSLLHRRYLGPEKPLARAWGVLGADWLKSDGTWNPADITSPLVYGIHHHVNGHTNQNRLSSFHVYLLSHCCFHTLHRKSWRCQGVLPGHAFLFWVWFF